MLVDNKFIFISLPRCASSSFMLTCVRNGLTMNHANPDYDGQHYDLSLSNDELLETITHAHERIIELKMRFGDTYEIIAIRRNKYERFLSVWNFAVKTSKRYGEDVYGVMRSLTIDDILFFNPNRLVKSEINKTTHEFLEKYNLTNKVDDFFKKILFIVWEPTSTWHNYDPNILWFDFEKLHELEYWVTNKIGKEFKLESSNSSKDVKSELKIDDNFIKKYDEIYNQFDLPKEKKTLL